MEEFGFARFCIPTSLLASNMLKEYCHSTTIVTLKSVEARSVAGKSKNHRRFWYIACLYLCLDMSFKRNFAKACNVENNKYQLE